MGKDGASRGSYGVSGPELATNGSDEALEVPDGLVGKTGPQESLDWALKDLNGASGGSDRALGG